MVPHLVPEISSLDAFCDVVGVGVVAGIGDSRSWMMIIIAVIWTIVRVNQANVDMGGGGGS